MISTSKHLSIRSRRNLMKLTPGKLAGLKKVSNERGVIAAAAMDQRGSLQKSLAKEKGGEVNDEKKHAWVERIGDECRANDIPFFLEFVGYEEGADEKGLEYAKKKPHIVTESMREFSKDRYGVDVLKVEVPVNMKFVEGTESFGGQKAYTKKEAIDLFHTAASVASKPFIYLSAGVSNAEFSETLELAGESGVKFNGVLCGRATWKDGIPIYAKPGARAFRTWLETER